MAQPEKQLTEKLLDLSKRMFKQYTGVEIAFAQELIQLENEYKANTKRQHRKLINKLK